MQLARVTITDENIAWNAINWQEVNRRVNNLRRRIYRSSCEGNMKLVGSLQIQDVSKLLEPYAG